MKERGRPASYPALSLSLCLEKAKAMLESMQKPEKYMDAETFVSLAGYKGFDNNSAPKGFIAALNHFGLLERDPKTKFLRLSQALRLLSWGDREAKATLISEAIVRPQKYQLLFKVFQEKSAPTRMDFETILKDEGMADRAARMLAGSFSEDVALAEALGINPSSPLSEQERGSRGEKKSGKNREELILPSGAKVEFCFDRKPGKQDWQFIGDFAGLKAKRA